MTKRVLITGKNSYVGNRLEEYLSKEPYNYKVEKKSVRDEKWQKINFSEYDAVVHVAGIAHNSSNAKLKNLYYSINRDLTIQIAKKAKKDGVKQFIFMSSMIVFGNHSNGKTVITRKTLPNPDNFYGDSKLQAEKGLEDLESSDFKVAIVRPPMIYGKGSKGNYQLLSKLARRTPFFPNYPNKRSMLHIDNLCTLILLIIENNDAGKFHPQNNKYVQTSKMIELIAKQYNHKIYFTKSFNFLIDNSFKLSIVKKVFGNLCYDNSLSVYEKGVYQIVSLEESVIKTEK